MSTHLPQLSHSNWSVRLGLALVAVSTVLLELVLTRFFSASAGYHFAFMIVSMTMFGMTAGALYAFARPPADEEELYRVLSRYAALLALSIPLCYIIESYVNDVMSAIGPYLWIAITFVIYCIVFFFSGVCVSHCLTRFNQVGKMYACDLIGAAVSCPLLIVGLTITDPQMIMVTAGATAGISSLLFARNIETAAKKQKCWRDALIGLGVCFAASFAQPHLGVITALFGSIDMLKWTPIGRVVSSTFDGPAVTWSKVVSKEPPPSVQQKGLYIDFGAFTVMTSGSLTAEQAAPIKHDVTAIGNRIRPGHSLFVIGVGGGRDILTGLLYGQKKVDGIEVNPAIVQMIKKDYADFNGHLAERPGVNIFNDEARNWLARSTNKYGLIQCSLVDTWSASSSGAFMLTENVLYTKEAFELYLKRLDSDGVLCFLRWGDEHEPGQILRMLYLAKNALAQVGVTDYGNHIMLLSAPSSRDPQHNIGAMVVSPTSFSKLDVDNFAAIAKEEQYKLLWAPGVASVAPFAQAITSAGSDPGMPTDNRPFFFTPVKPPDSESSVAEPAQGKGLALLQFTFLQAAALVLLVIIFPVWKVMRGKLGTPRQTCMSAVFFGSLGAGFMLVEVGLVQRLTILLGNPTYGLSVVLFALLLASGIGSFVAQILVDKGTAVRKVLLGALAAAAILVFTTSWLFANFLPSLDAAQLGTRMAAAIAMVSAPGFFMGFGFPLGMTIFTKNAPTGGAWFWSVNGATSVLSSVLAAIISIVWGIETTLIAGACCYVLAMLSTF